MLTKEQMVAGLASLEEGKLSPSAIGDLVSIFRGYLSDLFANYSIESTFQNEDDNDGLGAQRCQKLAAVLLLFQENQFTPAAGFSATSSDGFNYSLDGENFELFKYAFGLFWELPKAFQSPFQNAFNRRTSAQGKYKNEPHKHQHQYPFPMMPRRPFN